LENKFRYDIIPGTYFMKDKVIYLDYNATTPVDERVLQAMMPYFSQHFGNAASRSHAFGWAADEAVRMAREKISHLLHCDPREIVFTSGATEAVNLAIKGLFTIYGSTKHHIIAPSTEHKAVLDTLNHLQKLGAEITLLPVQKNGLIDTEILDKEIRKETLMVCVMWANNETGVIQDMESIGRICASHQTILFSDATQAVGKIPVHPHEAGVHAIAFSAHKMYGPKGVGALILSQKPPRLRTYPLIHGGGHEKGLRSGTLNVPGIVGLGEAAILAIETMHEVDQKLRLLRDKLENSLLSLLPDISINGSSESRLPHVSNLCFKLVDAESLISDRRLALATGSACSSASVEPSHVLTGMGLNPSDAHSSVRFSMGRYTTDHEVEEATDIIIKGVNRFREESPIWKIYQSEKSI
jgi:cysteine desulfurase